MLHVYDGVPVITLYNLIGNPSRGRFFPNSLPVTQKRRRNSSQILTLGVELDLKGLGSFHPLQTLGVRWSPLGRYRVGAWAAQSSYVQPVQNS